MDLTTAFWYATGIVVLLLLLRVLARPVEILLRIAAYSVVGGLAIWVINLVGSPFGLHLALNPVAAIVAGMLGLPGVVSLGIIRLILS
jgi:inhibitor of the pro-sigma K processing machinery